MAKERKKKSVKKKAEVKKAKPEKEEVCEIFEVEKDGKEKTVKSCGIEEEKPATKEQLKKEKKIFITVIITMLAFVLFFLAFLWINYSTNHFKIEGVKFEIDKKTLPGITLYKTSLPGIINKNGTFIMGIYDTGQKADYNFYFRKDPRQIKDIPFHDTISQVKKFNVINSTEFSCNGDEIIAIQYLLRWYEALGGSIIKDENASCDEKGTYGWINIQEADESSIERFGPACYNLYVNNCEILEVTEKFMLETLISVHKKLGV